MVDGVHRDVLEAGQSKRPGVQAGTEQDDLLVGSSVYRVVDGHGARHHHLGAGPYRLHCHPPAHVCRFIAGPRLVDGSELVRDEQPACDRVVEPVGRPTSVGRGAALTHENGGAAGCARLHPPINTTRWRRGPSHSTGARHSEDCGDRTSSRVLYG